MNTARRIVATVSLSVLLLFALFVVSHPLLRAPVAPVVHVTVEPEATHDTSEPVPETTREPSTAAPEATPEPAPETGSPAYETGVRAGEELERLWTTTKDFGRGLWSTLTEKEN
jgi:hypothetical protein